MNECKDCRWFVDEQKTFTVAKCALLDKFTGEARKVCDGELFQAHPPVVPATTNIFGEPLDRDGRVAKLKSELQSNGNYLPTRPKQWKPAGIVVDTKVYGGIR